jgi:ribonucleoside-diphosphate reductase alpha chain
MAGKRGLTIDRYFTKQGKSAESYFEFEKRDADITDDNGVKLWTQKDAEFPAQWSKLASDITASKYFFGEQETPQRENSVKDLVGRVSSTIANWAVRQHYLSSRKEANIFEQELAYLAYSQKMAFNSPVWFNVGTHLCAKPSKEEKKAWRIADKNMTILYPTPFGNVEFNVKKGTAIPIQRGEDILYPQTAACFIQSVDDTMESIMELAEREALLFKYGSGTGTNLSSLRSSREKLSSGGKPSGPLAYWAFYDKVAGIVKSGGKTRRASKMDSLEDAHPDIMEFINSKREEEKLLHILIDNGIPGQRAQESVNYQNTNISIRATDAFMQAAVDDREWQTVPVHNKDMADKMPRYNAKKMLREIAEATHFCGDPGFQFSDTINRWYTCKNSEAIRASNPCSEYMFVDDSSCNLASQNLMAFREEDENEKFDIPAFERAIRLTTIAQDLEVDNSSYPTKKIAENSHKFRPLGMGYANLGALVMSFGLPYDSDEARAIAASITALMTANVYKTSAEMAKKIGTFKEFQKNKEPMIEIMKMHREALKQIQKDKLPKGLESILDTAEKRWDEVVELGEKYGYRNAQATVLAPTGTIGFMMDCDTKGVEPEIGLVQTKKLVGGGSLRLVNTTVEPTLRKLGYDEKQIQDMNKYILEKETIEGAPHIKEEHLAIFDCSNKPEGAKRTIPVYGHLKMMAAVQPFISGAISKTVNMPKEATVEEIEQAYIDSWKMGLKAVAIYRDKSKRAQPLNFSDKGLEGKVKPVRRKLPITRPGIIHKFEIAGHEGYLKVGLYDDGTPGETFIDMSKEGTTIKGLMDSLAISLSLNLQYCVPLEKLVEKFRHQKFEPYGLVHGHPEIHTADSIVDYLAHFLQKQFNLKNGNGDESKELTMQQVAEIPVAGKKEESTEEAGGFCTVCGARMVKKGHCKEVCSKCGWESPKGCGE